MNDNIFVVLIPWHHEGCTMKAIEVFNTKKEAIDYIDGVQGWEVLEVTIPREVVK